MSSTDEDRGGLGAATGSESTQDASNDDITAQTAARRAGAEGALAEAVGSSLTWGPYAVYLGLWVALALASAAFLSEATAEVPPRWLPAYEPLVYAGVVLAALGPALSCAVWAVARRHRTPAGRRGLFVAAIMRGAVTGFFGLLVWIATLYALEMRALRGAF